MNLKIMINSIYNKLKNNENPFNFIKQFSKFIIVGIINTLLTFLVFKILTDLLLINDSISNISGYIIGVINSFFLNKFWTFKSRIISFKEFISFVSIFLISFSLQFIAYITLRNVFSINKDIAFLGGMVIYTLTNFLLNKYITFKK